MSKAVLDMLKDVETASELSVKHFLHPAPITKQRRIFLDRAPDLFSEKGAEKEESTEKFQAELY